MPKGFRLAHFETNLQAIMDCYVKQNLAELGHVARYQFFINPISNKVLFECFIRKDEPKEVKTDFGSVEYDPNIAEVTQG